MKRLLILLFIVLFSVFVNARPINMIGGSTYLIENKNITLVRAFDEKAVICINGVSGIVNEGIIKTINEVNVNLKTINNNIASFDFGYSCKKNCDCKGSGCDNSNCLIENSIVKNENNVNAGTIVENKESNVPIEKAEVVNNQGINSTGVIAACLIIFILILGIIVLWRRS